MRRGGHGFVLSWTAFVVFTCSTVYALLVQKEWIKECDARLIFEVFKMNDAQIYIDDDQVVVLALLIQTAAATLLLLGSGMIV